MKILFCADVSASRVIGGAERVLQEQSKRLAISGHNVRIITRHYPFHKCRKEMMGAVEEWRYPTFSNNAFAAMASTMINGRRCILDLLGQYPIDCVNAHQPFTAFSALRQIRRRRIPLIYTCHSLAFEEYISRNKSRSDKNNLSLRLNAWIRRAIEKIVLHNSTHILALSEFTQKKILSAHHLIDKPISIVPAGVDLDKFHPVRNKSGVRSGLRLHDDKFIIFTVRNLVPRMGLENLIQAVCLIKEQIPNLLLIIGGTGPLGNRLKETVKNAKVDTNVRFEGFIPEEELASYYQASDAFILPTKELEGFGLITLEALASGLPVFGTPVGSTPEILRQFGHKFIFKDTSAEAMAQSIVAHYHDTLRDLSLSETLSINCRTFAEKNYSWDKNIYALESLFEQTIDRNPKEVHQ